MLVKEVPGVSTPGLLCNIGHPSETHLKVKSRKVLLAHNLFVQSFWHFAQSTTAILLCSVQYSKLIGQLKCLLWMNEIWWDISLRWFSVGYLYCIASQDFNSHSADYTLVHFLFMCCHIGTWTKWLKSADDILRCMKSADHILRCNFWNAKYNFFSSLVLYIWVQLTTSQHWFR